MSKERYIDIHRNAKNLLYNTYIDLNYLKVLGKINNDDPSIRLSKHSLVHLCKIIKADLCLNISKLCFDGDSRAASINNLQTSLNNIYKERGKDENKRSFTDKTMAQKDKVKAMRNKYIAHCDITRIKDDIYIADLQDIFEDVRSFFNELSDPTIDSNATPFSNIEMMYLTIQSTGFDKLIHDGAF